MLNYSVKVTDHCCIVQVHISPTVALNEFVGRLRIEILLHFGFVMRISYPKACETDLVSFKELS